MYPTQVQPIANVQVTPLGERNPEDFGSVATMSIPMLWDAQGRSSSHGTQAEEQQVANSNSGHGQGPNVLPTPTSRGQIRKQRRVVSISDELNSDAQVRNAFNGLDLSLEDMGLSLLSEDLEMSKRSASHTSPRSQLLAELLADTPKSSLFKAKAEALDPRFKLRTNSDDISPLSPASMSLFSSQLLGSVQGTTHCSRMNQDRRKHAARRKDMRRLQSDPMAVYQESGRNKHLAELKGSAADLDLSFEELGLSLLGEDIDLSRPAPGGTISPRSQLIAELLADTPKSSKSKDEGAPAAAVDQNKPPLPLKNHTTEAESKPNPPQAAETHTIAECQAAPAEEKAIENPVRTEHINPRLRVVCQDKRHQQGPGGHPVTQTQMLWHKYGEKTVRNRKATGNSSQLVRAYYRCYKKECSARITVDLDHETHQLVKSSSSGTHNHFFQVAADENYTMSCVPSS